MVLSKSVLIYTYIFLVCVSATLIQSQINNESSSSINAVWVVENLIRNCFEYSVTNTKSWNKLVSSLRTCLKNHSLRALDIAQQYHVIELWRGMQLVKNNTYQTIFKMRRMNNGESSNWDKMDWNKQIVKKIENILTNHVLKIHLGDKGDRSEGRRRHHHGMMPLMMFGTLALGLILVPMGFQFLAVLGGKALLLAKMALILTSIQGLKKIATSNVNYGLYHTPNPWHYDRQWPYNTEDVDLSTRDQFYDLPDEFHTNKFDDHSRVR